MQHNDILLLDFLVWTIFKLFIEFVTILFLFYALVFYPWGMWDLAPRQGIKPALPTLAGKVLITGSPEKSLSCYFNPHSLLVLFCSYSCEVKVAQSCPTLCDPMDYTVHGILQARILEWVAFSFSRGSSQPRSPTLQAGSLPAERQGKPFFTPNLVYFALLLFFLIKLMKRLCIHY